MTDTPPIKISGHGSRREAAKLGETISAGASNALAGHDAPLRIDTLRVQARAGASRAEIERAIRLAIAREMRGGRR